jgi:hypothetical protein
MNKTLLALAILLCVTHVQGQNIEGQIVASQYGVFHVPSYQDESSTGFVFTPGTCQVSGGGRNFVAFSAGVPMKIVDGNPALTEIATPSAVNVDTCSITVTTSHAHQAPYFVTSGTGGLQEAISANGSNTGANTIILNGDWYALVAPGTPSAVIAAAKGSTSLGLVDVTTTPYTTYSWNGSQYVANASGGGASTPATSEVLKGNGSANGVVAATPGTDFAVPVTAAAAFEALVSTGAGTTYAAQAVPLSFNSSFDQYISQQTTNSNWTTLGVNNLNNIFYVDGYISETYPGIGVTQVAWNSGTNEPVCQAISYSGTNYIAVQGNNSAITPGTNTNYWQVVPNPQATTQVDCAFYLAATYAESNSVTTTVRLGEGTYSTNGMVEPLNLYGVNIEGCGIFCTYLYYTGSAAVPMISRPDGGDNYVSLIIRNMLMNGNSVASSMMDLGQLNQSVVENIEGYNVAAGIGNHFFEFGLSPGDAFQMHASNLTWGGLLAGYGEPSTYPVITANLGSGGTAGEIVSYTIVNGGAGFPATPAGLMTQWTGNQNGTSDKPCTTLPTSQPTPTFVGGVLTALTPVGSGSALGVGCSGTVDVQLYSAFPADYGIVWNASDSTGDDLIGYAGKLANIQVNAGNNVFHHLHPSVVPNGIIDNGGNTYTGTECDVVHNKCFDFEQAFTTQGSTVYGTNGYAGTRLIPGSTTYYFGPTAVNVAIGPSGSLCPGSSNQTDYHTYMTPSGPVDLGAAPPAGLNVSNPDTTNCGTQTTGWIVANPSQGPAIAIDPHDGNANSYIGFGTANNTKLGWGQTAANPLTAIVQSSYAISFVEGGTFGTGQVGGFNTTGEPQLEVSGAVASASTIQPFGGGVSHITGTTTINTITPNSGCTTSGIACQITLISDGGFSTSASGNISVALTTVAGYAYIFTYDPATSKWYPTH